MTLAPTSTSTPTLALTLFLTPNRNPAGAVKLSVDLPEPQPAVFATYRMLDSSGTLEGVTWDDFETLYEALDGLRYKKA